MIKIENVDIEDAMWPFAKLLTFDEFSQSIGYMVRKTKQRKRKPSAFLFVMSDRGNECASYDQAFLKGSNRYRRVLASEHRTYAGYAYIVVVKEVVPACIQDKIIGDIYPIKLQPCLDHLKEQAVPMKAEQLWFYENGMLRGKKRPEKVDPAFGFPLWQEGQPRSKAALQKVLQKEKTALQNADVKHIPYETYLTLLTEDVKKKKANRYRM